MIQLHVSDFPKKALKKLGAFLMYVDFEGEQYLQQNKKWKPGYIYIIDYGAINQHFESLKVSDGTK